jgi:uncharacterized protein YjbI with pentapeptide repeats
MLEKLQRFFGIKKFQSNEAFFANDFSDTKINTKAELEAQFKLADDNFNKKYGKTIPSNRKAAVSYNAAKEAFNNRKVELLEQYIRNTVAEKNDLTFVPNNAFANKASNKEQIAADSFKIFMDSPKAMREKIDLTGINLSGMDLRKVNLVGLDLSGANLAGADLRGVNLTGVNLSGANLNDANLTGANLSNTKLNGATIHNAIIPMVSDEQNGQERPQNTNFNGTGLYDFHDNGGFKSASKIITAVKTGSALAPQVEKQDEKGQDAKPKIDINKKFKEMDESILEIQKGVNKLMPKQISSTLKTEAADNIKTNSIKNEEKEVDLLSDDVDPKTVAKRRLTNLKNQMDDNNISGEKKVEILKEYLNRDVSSLPSTENLFIDLSGINLQGLDLRGMNLSHINFTGANLANTKLDGANLSYSIFNGAKLERTQLVNADMTGCKLQNANLKKANLAKAILLNADLTNADLRGADLTNGNLNYANLMGASLLDADQKGMSKIGVKTDKTTQGIERDNKSIAFDGLKQNPAKLQNQTKQSWRKSVSMPVTPKSGADVDMNKSFSPGSTPKPLTSGDRSMSAKETMSARDASKRHLLVKSPARRDLRSPEISGRA